jgi:hypothetical protein
LLAATQHRIEGDVRERDTDIDRARKRPAMTGRGEVKGKTESDDNTEERGSKRRNQASTKRLFLFSPPLPAV